MTVEDMNQWCEEEIRRKLREEGAAMEEPLGRWPKVCRETGISPRRMNEILAGDKLTDVESELLEDYYNGP